MNASETIRKIRMEKGYSQEYMADQLGISQSAYSKLERGNTKLTVDRLEQIADVLGITFQEILPLDKPNLLDKEKRAGDLETEVGFLKSMLKGLFEGKGED